MIGALLLLFSGTVNASMGRPIKEEGKPMDLDDFPANQHVFEIPVVAAGNRH